MPGSRVPNADKAGAGSILQGGWRFSGIAAQRLLRDSHRHQEQGGSVLERKARQDRPGASGGPSFLALLVDGWSASGFTGANPCELPLVMCSFNRQSDQERG